MAKYNKTQENARRKSQAERNKAKRDGRRERYRMTDVDIQSVQLVPEERGNFGGYIMKRDELEEGDDKG